MNESRLDRLTFAPATDFEVFGLDETWQGNRCLDNFRGASGQPPTELWLCHLSTDHRSGVRVGTVHSGRNDAEALQKGTERRAVAAARGVYALVDLTIPNEEGWKASPPPAGFSKYLLSRFGDVDQWNEKVSWEINRERFSVPVWRFAGAWVGLCDTLADVYLVLVGVGVDADGLRIISVPDGTPYGLELDQALDRGWASRQDRDWYDTAIRRPNPDRFHSDYQELFRMMSEPGS